jgi:hypothetical protein
MQVKALLDLVERNGHDLDKTILTRQGDTFLVAGLS